MGTTAQVTAWSATVMGTTAQVTAWTAGGGPWGRGPLVLATYYCDFRCLNTKPFFINTDIWASIKCRFPDILIWISEAVFQSLIISHYRGKCLSESQTENQKKKKQKTKNKKTKKPFNPSTRESEAGRFLSLRRAWSTKWVPGQPGLYRETLSRKTTTTTKQKQTNKNIFLDLL